MYWKSTLVKILVWAGASVVSILVAEHNGLVGVLLALVGGIGFGLSLLWGASA